MNYYRPRFFQLSELVDPILLTQYGDKCWNFLDARMLWTIDQLRLKFGMCIINGVYQGRRYTESGLRRFDTPTGAKMSAHKLGKGFDLKFTGSTAEGIRLDMQANPKLDAYKFITRCERDTSWLHIDNFNAFSTGIMFIRP